MCQKISDSVDGGGRAEGLACADPGARTPIGASGNFISIFNPKAKLKHKPDVFGIIIRLKHIPHAYFPRQCIYKQVKLVLVCKDT